MSRKRKKKFQDNFTYVAFLDLKIAYDSVPIYNILIKLYKFDIRSKCFDFLTNLYMTSKAPASLLGLLSDKFSIHRDVHQSWPLSPILFNIFIINDVLANCNDLGVSNRYKKVLLWTF
jgi:hypothetical protein